MAGETSLARQLKKLSVPQTSVLVQDKIRKSFLFDHREAAALDRDVIFAYGTTGLEKLRMINPIFGKFEDTLFSIGYKDFERSVQTLEKNKKLDEKITEFLRMLSPYFLIRAAHEALEWLVYRFHIHLYNTDALIESVLPHFNTSTFVRIVQLLNLQDSNSRWFWLLPVQKSGVHVEYSAILNHFNVDGGFRKFVCDMAKNSLKVFKKCESVATPIISFSMLTVYSALGKCLITDNMITFLFPYIMNGLKSNINKYIAVTYLVISKIVTNVKVTDALVSELLLKVFENVKTDLMKEAFELLLLIFQQQPITFLTVDLFKLLVFKKEYLKHLIYMSESYDIDSLLKATIKKLLAFLLSLRLRRPNSNKCKVVSRFSKELIDFVALNEKTFTVCFNVILNRYSKLQFKCNSDKKHCKKTVKLLLKSLETKYPVYFDSAINSFFKKEKNHKKNALRKLINQSVCSIKSKMLPDLHTTLVIGLYHANSEIRKASITYLLQQAESNQLSDRDFVKNSLYDRLLDDSNEVVLKVLSTPEVLLQYLEKRKVLAAFTIILQKKIRKHSDWYNVQIECLNILCTYFVREDELAFELFATLLPFIFPVLEHSIDGFLQIVNSELNSFLPVIQMLEVSDSLKLDENVVINKEQLEQLNIIVVASIKKYVQKLSASSKSEFFSFLKEKCNESDSVTLRVIFVLTAGHAIVSGTELNEMRKWIKELLAFLKSLSPTILAMKNFDDGNENMLTEKCFKDFKKNRFPSIIIYQTLSQIVKFMKLEFSAIKCTTWLQKENSPHFNSFEILFCIFEFFIQLINSEKPLLVENSKKLMSNFIDSQFKTEEHFYGFLISLWSNISQTYSIELQVYAMKSVLSCESKGIDCFFSNFTFFLSLSKAVSSLDFEVRKTALNLLSSLLQHSEFNNHLKSLAVHIIEHQEEIATDSTQYYSVLMDWFEPVIENFDSKNAVLLGNSILQHKLLVLDSYVQVLSDDCVPLSIKHHVLLCLKKAESVEILSAYIPVINKLLPFPEDDGSLEILNHLLQKFIPKTAVCLKDDCIETETLFRCLQIVEQGQKSVRLQLPILKILSRDFFAAIPSVAVQKKLLTILLNVYLSTSSDLSVEVKKTLNKLCTFAYLVLKDILDKGMTTPKGTTLRDLKRTKTADLVKSSAHEKDVWKKVTVILEIIQNKTKLEKRELLVPELFNLLNKTLNSDTQSSVEYIRQLILSTIYNCCQHLGSSGLDERQFQVELIVQCIRTSTNPKTHHQALLLLNLAATMFPDYVLSNVMSIFTFMGSSLVRQDDSYSFQVISQTIETIVPSLLAASSCQKPNDAMQIVAAVIRVFVDSLSDIPRHRQLPLFSKLVTTLGASEYLWIPLGQICDEYSTVFHDMTSDDISNWKISPTLEFAVNLHKQFSSIVQIVTCINLLNFLSVLPDKKKKSGSDQTSENTLTEPFNVANHTDQQLQIYKYNVLSYINIWLSSQTFVGQVSEMDSRATSNLEEKYEILLEKALYYLQHQRNLSQVSEKEGRNRHCLFPLLFDLIGHVNSLLPCNLFIRVVRRLLRNSETVIQKKAIELLNCKLEEQQQLFKDGDHASLLKLLNPLLKIARNETDSTEMESSTLNQQTALYALHLLTKVIGQEYPAKFLKVLTVAIHILKVSQNNELKVNALLCLAQLCGSLNIEVLPQLNTFMPIVVDLLTDYKTICFNDTLILGIITTLLSLVENLGVFLSSYMQSIIVGVSILSTRYLDTSKKIVHDKLLSFQTLIAKDVALRILLSAIGDSYSKIAIEDHNAVIPLMHLLEEKVNFCTFTDIELCSTQLEQFFLQLLDFRNANSNLLSTSLESVSAVESSIISALKTLVMKLPETRFRMFFQKIYQWATATEEKLKLRIFTFYRLTCQLSISLKNFVVVVAKYFLKHAATELDCNNSSKSNPTDFVEHPLMLSQHLSNILGTLDICFLYDDGQLLDKDNFEFLLQPLVDQLENLSGEDGTYQERINNHLCGCVARFMAAVSDNVLWKKLNYQILLKTRHDSPIVRFAAIQVIREVVTVMGDNYLVLLPESIPFLAEVMEDESSEVEHECQSVIVEMEKVLGEPIRKYF